MKFKFLSKEQLTISFDRLTRFKSVKERYLRVFSDIILSCVIEPKYKKNDLEKMSPRLLTDIAQEIINTSLKNITDSDLPPDIAINRKIKEYEKSVYNMDIETEEFLDNNINYSLFNKFLNTGTPHNLDWLKSLCENSDIRILRKEKGFKHPIEKVVLAEGLTEEILLPAFSDFMGYDFYKNGVQIIAAGGKNQVVKLYYKLSSELKIPIFALLDRDAKENITQIQPRLRKNDRIHLVTCGEFEDLLPKSLIIKTLNQEFKNFAAIQETDFDSSLSNAKNLEEIFKQKGQHEFKKADFAKLVRDNIKDKTDISPEISQIILELIH